MTDFELVLRAHQGEQSDLSAFASEEAVKAHSFHTGFAQYSQTPLTGGQQHPCKG